jgi:hypothetical protein
VETWRLKRFIEGFWGFVVAMQTERMRKLGATRSMEETVDLEMSEEIGKVSVV